MFTTSRLARGGLLVALSLVLYIVEGLIPVPFIVPGAKLGLANIVTVVALAMLGPRDAFVIVTLRTFLASLITGNLTSFWFSLAGAILSTLVMSLAYIRFREAFSLAGISILGGIFHNIGQLFVASIVVGTYGIYSYLPLLLVAGTCTGYFVGLAASLIIQAMRSNPVFPLYMHDAQDMKDVQAGHQHIQTPYPGNRRERENTARQVTAGQVAK
ncbi:MAG TPA: Gx transporter family protein [Firmicutes bacterium]|nr:Gx transporter family protein [Bacillota bacterium]